MEIYKKRFDDLTNREVYELLKSRSAIFVVEQDCVYLDIDGADYDSLHVFCKDEDGTVTAYLRIYDKKNEPGTAQIGRVITLKHGTGLGGIILKAGIEAAFENPDVKKIFIEAQCYATGYYEREGFVISSDEFLEDGIPHVEMILNREDWKR